MTTLRALAALVGLLSLSLVPGAERITGIDDALLRPLAFVHLWLAAMIACRIAPPTGRAARLALALLSLTVSGLLLLVTGDVAPLTTTLVLAAEILLLRRVLGGIRDGAPWPPGAARWVVIAAALALLSFDHEMDVWHPLVARPLYGVLLVALAYSSRLPAWPALACWALAYLHASRHFLGPGAPPGRVWAVTAFLVVAALSPALVLAWLSGAPRPAPAVPLTPHRRTERALACLALAGPLAMGALLLRDVSMSDRLPALAPLALYAALPLLLLADRWPDRWRTSNLALPGLLALLCALPLTAIFDAYALLRLPLELWLATRALRQLFGDEDRRPGRDAAIASALGLVVVLQLRDLGHMGLDMSRDGTAVGAALLLGGLAAAFGALQALDGDPRHRRWLAIGTLASLALAAAAFTAPLLRLHTDRVIWLAADDHQHLVVGLVPTAVALPLLAWHAGRR